MRISGGAAKGIRLVVPPGSRPAAERVRQAVFSSLGERVRGARVLDVFCGSGAYGLEALSRGAVSAVFVDRDRAAIRAVRANAAACGFDERVRAHRRDVLHGVPSGEFDLAFADPPYAGTAPPARVLEAVRAAVTGGGTVVIEARAGEDDPNPSRGFILEGDRRYGDTRVLTYRREGSSR